MRELIKNSTVYLRGTSETHCISMCLHYNETGTVNPVNSNKYLPTKGTEYMHA